MNSWGGDLVIDLFVMSRTNIILIGLGEGYAYLVFDFHATTAFDVFSATYFFMARRAFCLLRRRKFFRASCFMLILLVRRAKPAGCLRMGVARLRVRHPRPT
jgi:hypothetical protein